MLPSRLEIESEWTARNESELGWFLRVRPQKIPALSLQKTGDKRAGTRA